MKFYSNGLSNLISKIEKGEVNSLLLHGVNQGFCSTAITQISKKCSLLVTNINSQEITPTKLDLIANSKNFFAQRELIKLTNIGSSITKEMKSLLDNAQFYHFICFSANDSLPPSGIRKFFEEGSNLASLGCYYENEQTIEKIILQQCNKHKQQIDKDALSYLKFYLKGDHQIIKSELDKLFAFTHDKTSITKDDVEQTLSGDLLASGDEMCIFFATKKPSLFLQEVKKLQQQNKNEILMIRALIRYYLNIYKVTMQIENGSTLEQAIRTLYPPIFFKYINDFKAVAGNYTPADAINCISLLQEAEINYKTNPQSFDLFAVYQSVQK